MPSTRHINTVLLVQGVGPINRESKAEGPGEVTKMPLPYGTPWQADWGGGYPKKVR